MKIRLYKSAVGSIVRVRAESYTMDEKVRRRLNNFNSKAMAGITGRSISEEAKNPTYDLLTDIKKARAKWLGHILRLDRNSTLVRTLEEFDKHGKKYEGNLLEVAPSYNSFNELREFARDRERWREHVKNITRADSFTPLRSSLDGEGDQRRSMRLRSRGSCINLID